MTNIYIYALADAVADIAGLGAAAPKGFNIHVRDGSLFKDPTDFPDQAEENPTAIFVHAVDPASPTAAEIALFDAVDLFYSPTYFARQVDDDDAANLLATAAVLADASIRIANTNRAPTVANALVNQVATELAAFSYQFAANSFADADGASDTLTYTATLTSGAALPAYLTFTAATRTLAGTIDDATAGTVSVRVKATDKAKAFVTDDFDIVISAD